jgi:putative transposase
LYQACEVNGWALHELSVQPDHLHLLVQLPPTVSVSDAVQAFKGGTSHALRKEFPDLAEFLWGTSLWGDGYFAETVGHTEEGVIRRYIREQGREPGQNVAHQQTDKQNGN